MLLQNITSACSIISIAWTVNVIWKVVLLFCCVQANFWSVYVNCEQPLLHTNANNLVSAVVKRLFWLATPDPTRTCNRDDTETAQDKKTCHSCSTSIGQHTNYWRCAQNCKYNVCHHCSSARLRFLNVMFLVDMEDAGECCIDSSCLYTV